jgi:NADH dehydrogenase FAD-containing subunit
VTSRLKRIEDATTMRRRILVAFEHAEDAADEAERGRLLTFVIIGGGPTGVDLAGALAELARAALARDFRNIDPKTAHIVLVEAGPRLLPWIAPVAKQQGAYAAGTIAARLAGNPAPPPFRYRDFGNVLTIERREAVVDFGWLKLTGRVAWLVWGAAHIYFLIGFRNRIVVALDWLWSYLSYQRGARLITGQDM